MTTETEGVTHLHVDISVTLADMATWSPERIAAFFDGIARIRTAVHQGDSIERARSEWRHSEENARHLECCLEELARTVGVDPDDLAYDGELWASNVTTAIVQALTCGRDV